MAEKIPITPEGKQDLENELKTLLSQHQPEALQNLSNALEDGDLRENGDYTASIEALLKVAKRIDEIKICLSNAQVIDPKLIQSDKIVFGATVILEEEDGKKVQYQLVGADEFNVKNGKISIHSPLARALIGRSAGDEVVVEAPKGRMTYSILEIFYQ